ncbi:DUF11 domain-containing protein, partial [uncultured Methanobrevibacter sp.]|uniref:DUF11 domain-containing protein n=1 Tax=uncultured Methanobrevibacter sp. TaxID=253161 RepID=UPI0026240C60
EVSVDGYTVAVSNSSAYAFTVTNTHVPVVTENNTYVNLVIEKMVSNSTPELGDVITWTITVTNNGPDIAENVVITDELPAGLVLINSDVYWVFDSIAPGESVSVAVKTLVNMSGTIVNVATVTTTSNNTGDDKTNKTINVTKIVPIEIEVGNTSTPNYGNELNETEVVGKNNETEEPPLEIYEIPEVTPEESIQFVVNKTPSENVDTPVISVPDTPEPVINQTNDDDNLTTPEVDVPENVPVSNNTNGTNPGPDDNHDREDNPTDNPVDNTVTSKNNTPDKDQTQKQTKSSDVEVNEKQTGNPILVLLLTLMSIFALEIKRERK